jgi:hypothetical protein
LIKYKIIELVDFFELKVFEDASTDSQILILEKNNTSCSFNYSPIKNIADFKDNLYSRIEIDPQNLSDEIWVFNNSNDLNILNKMKETSISLDDYTKNGIFRGITTGLNEAFIINEEIKNKIIAEDPKSSELIKPYVTGTEIEKFNLNIRNKYYLLHIKWEFNPKEYPGIFKYLEKHKLKLEIRPEVKEKRYNWYAMSRYASDYFHLFELPKIIYIHTIHPCKQGHILKKDSGFDNVSHCQSCFFKNVFDILQRLASLSFYPFSHLSRSGINRQLTGHKYHTIGFYRLTIRADSPRSFLTANYFFHIYFFFLFTEFQR